MKTKLKFWTSQIETQQNILAGARWAKTDHSMQMDSIDPIIETTDHALFTTNRIIPAHSLPLMTDHPMQSMTFAQVLNETITQWKLTKCKAETCISDSC